MLTNHVLGRSSGSTPASEIAGSNPTVDCPRPRGVDSPRDRGRSTITWSGQSTVDSLFLLYTKPLR